MEIPLVVALWEYSDFRGRRRLFVEDTEDLSSQYFDGKTSAVGVHQGPDYEEWKNAHKGKEPTVGLYEHKDYRGAVLTLSVGEYHDIHRLYNFGDAISSVKFNPSPRKPHPFDSLPLIVEIYAKPDFQGRWAVIVEDVLNISAYLGSNFDNAVNSVRVRKGTNFTGGKKAVLFENNDFNSRKEGKKIELPCGDYPDLGKSHGFADMLSSIKVS